MPTGTPLYINWYTGALLISLLLAPYFFEVVKPGKHYWLRAACLLGVLIAVGIAYIDETEYMMISRLPVMVVGMIAAGCTVEERKLKWLIPGMLVVCAAALVVLYRCLDHYQELLITYAMYWHPFVVIAPVGCMAASWVLARMHKSVLKPLKLLGEASFEIFLFNAWIEKLGSFGLMTNAAQWLLWSVISVAAGICYHMLIGKMQNVIQQKIQKRG